MFIVALFLMPPYLKISQIYSHKLRDKQNMVYPYNRMLLNSIKKWTIDIHAT